MVKSVTLHWLGTNLVKKAIYAMVEGDCDEVRVI